jgi:protein-disulfide isomerase
MAHSTRLIVLAATGFAALLIVVVAIVLGTHSKAKTPTTSAAVAAAAAPAAYLTGLPQHGKVLGKPGAPATLYVFEDPQCPYCRDWSLGDLESVVKNYVRPGTVKLSWEGIAIVGDNSVAGLKAAYAAGEQNKLWQFVDQLYQRQGAENSGWISDPVLRDAAAVAGADPGALMAAAGSSSVQRQLDAAARQATAFHVDHTPDFVVVRPPQQPVTLQLNSLDPGAFASALDAALR